MFTKFLHIIGIIMMLGATFCNGVIHLNAMKDKSVRGKLTSLNNIMIINRRIMIPGFTLLIFAGLFMAYQTQISLRLDWLLISIIITAILLAEFIWGYRLEKNLENLTNNQLRDKLIDYDKRYKNILKIAVPIGSSATILSLFVIYLMIVKPF